ncbi:unnamed protein product [Ixodes pacificus]
MCRPTTQVQVQTQRCYQSEAQVCTCGLVAQQDNSVVKIDMCHSAHSLPTVVTFDMEGRKPTVNILRQQDGRLLIWASNTISLIGLKCEEEVSQGMNPNLVLADPFQVMQNLRCPGDCSYHGVCNGRECFCDEGYAGPDCSQPDVQAGFFVLFRQQSPGINNMVPKKADD